MSIFKSGCVILLLGQALASPASKPVCTSANSCYAEVMGATPSLAGCSSLSEKTVVPCDITTTVATVTKTHHAEESGHKHHHHDDHDEKDKHKDHHKGHTSKSDSKSDHHHHATSSHEPTAHTLASPVMVTNIAEIAKANQARGVPLDGFQALDDETNPDKEQDENKDKKHKKHHKHGEHMDDEDAKKKHHHKHGEKLAEKKTCTGPHLESITKLPDSVTACKNINDFSAACGCFSVDVKTITATPRTVSATHTVTVKATESHESHSEKEHKTHSEKEQKTHSEKEQKTKTKGATDPSDVVKAPAANKH